MNKPLLHLLAALAFSTTAMAEVRETAPNAFHVETSISSTAPPAAVYSALTRHIGKWWDSGHTFSGDSRNLTLDKRPGGCFCERLPGGGVQHARVIYADAGKMLRLEGSLGPLQEMAVAGVWTFKLDPEGTGTKVTMNYRIAGALTMDSAKLAPLVEQVLTVQLQRLKAFADLSKRNK